MKVGTTGTHLGATTAQLETLAELLKLKGATGLDHGDCVGADAQGHDVARSLGGIFITSHPPLKDALRAFRAADLILPPKPYLDRNRDIVDATEYLIGMPDSRVERVRSGTWYTIRYARRIRREYIIIAPDGRTFK